jgi:outer membrane receptor protein involved in Fe transport
VRSSRSDIRSRLALLIRLVFAVAVLGAPLAGAEEPEQLAQAGDPKPGAAEPDAAADPDAAAKPDLGAKPTLKGPPPSGIEEIIVQGAESESTGDFDDADSVTGFGSEDLAALGAQDIADLAAFTPNLEIVTAGATTPTFFIRGVGLNDFNSNSTGAVAIYQDDVPVNAPALQLSTLFDVEAVNVLRGPQGTGLARNASAGAIKIYSRKPTGVFGGFLRSELGNYDLRDFEGAVEAPIWGDTLAARLAFRFTERDGTMKNRCGNAPPMADRVQYPGLNPARDIGKSSTDAPWSICGEPVDASIPGDYQGIPGTIPSISRIPVDLPGWLNNVDNWAARGTLLFQPTLDMSWLINGHGSMRSEWSRVGQSIGTEGKTCANGDVANCNYAGFGGNDTTEIDGVLGGQQGLARPSYVTSEIRTRLIELAPCYAPISRQGSLPGLPGGNCEVGPTNARFVPGNLAISNAAKVTLGEELAKNLDSKPWEGDFNLCGTNKFNSGPRVGQFIDRDGTGTYCNKDKGKTTNNTYGGYLQGTVDLPFGLQLTSITGYDHYDRMIDIDLDFSPETLFQIRTDDDGWQVTQGVQLAGALGNEGAVRWDIGGWLLREQLNVVVTNDLGPLSGIGVGERDYVQDLWSSAGYASLAFDFWDDFTLDGGFRYNWEEKKLDYELASAGCSALPGGVCAEFLNDAWTAPTGTIRLTYRFREDTHAYWKYTRGWKPGTYNATSSPVTGVSTAEPETINAFETGMRGSWFEGRVGIDFSLFYYNYENYQIFTAQQFAGGQPEFVIINADAAEVYGAEVDAVARPWPGAFANVRFGWLETEFLDFTQIQQETIIQNGSQVTVNRELQNTGNSLLNSPEFKVSLTGEQTIPLGRWGSVTARYDGVWTDTTFYDATEGAGLPNNEDIQYLPKGTTAQGSYWLHNVRVGYRPPGGRIEIAGWVRNLTNQSYKTFAFDASTFNETSIYFVGDPRTFGGTLTVTF